MATKAELEAAIKDYIETADGGAAWAAKVIADFIPADCRNDWLHSVSGN